MKAEGSKDHSEIQPEGPGPLLGSADMSHSTFPPRVGELACHAPPPSIQCGLVRCITIV